jgi:hypothetical protein
LAAARARRGAHQGAVSELRQAASGNRKQKWHPSKTVDFLVEILGESAKRRGQSPLQKNMRARFGAFRIVKRAAVERAAVSRAVFLPLRAAYQAH